MYKSEYFNFYFNLLTTVLSIDMNFFYVLFLFDNVLIALFVPLLFALLFVL